MAKQPKTPAKKTAAKKAAKKVAKPKTAVKSAAQKPAAKKPPAKKVGGKKTVAKKVAAQKPAANTAKKAAKKSKPAGKKVATKARTTTPAALLTAEEPASPTIGQPADGATVPANTGLEVKIHTNRTDVNYTITITDTSVTPPAVTTLPANAPGTSPFSVTVPAAALPPGHTIKIKAETNPAAGHGSDEINVTTTSAGGGGGAPIED